MCTLRAIFENQEMGIAVIIDGFLYGILRILLERFFQAIGIITVLRIEREVLSLGYDLFGFGVASNDFAYVDTLLLQFVHDLVDVTLCCGTAEGK